MRRIRSIHKNERHNLQTILLTSSESLDGNNSFDYNHCKSPFKTLSRNVYSKVLCIRPDNNRLIMAICKNWGIMVFCHRRRIGYKKTILEETFTMVGHQIDNMEEKVENDTSAR